MLGITRLCLDVWENNKWNKNTTNIILNNFLCFMKWCTLINYDLFIMTCLSSIYFPSNKIEILCEGASISPSSVCLWPLNLYFNPANNRTLYPSVVCMMLLKLNFDYLLFSANVHAQKCNFNAYLQDLSCTSCKHSNVFEWLGYSQ